MKPAEVYVDLDGNEIALAGLDSDERRLIAQLRRRARTQPDWTDFDNYWTRELVAFYDARGMRRSAVRTRAPFRIALDLSGRLAISSGLVREGDYLDELEELIDTQYATRRAFCQATGLAEDMLNHVLAGRKDLSLKALTEALARIGYALHIKPLAARQRLTQKPAARKRTG